MRRLTESMRGFVDILARGSPLFYSLLLFNLLAAPAHAQSPQAIGTEELRRLTLEDLMKVEVTSVSRREERASEAAASVHVITDEDVRRSGARSLPETLRLAPNLQVAQATARAWAISARGFNASFSNKLLVLIDGRSVYTPLFSGVFWDAQDTLLEDLDRIEVISGPGATLWGANAVNGVINIITKPAHETQGVLVSLGSATEERAAVALRYGGKTTEDLSYRVYGKFFDRDDSVLPDGADGRDAWRSGQAGFRLDRETVQNRLTLQGDVYQSAGEQPEGDDINWSGGNLLARWVHIVSASERVQVQAYYDRTHQFVPGDFGDTLNMVDIDVQYERQAGRRHHIVAGAGYRLTDDRARNLPGSIAFLPAAIDLHLFSAFVQDEIPLHERVRVTVGSKLEHNDYTGLETQPSVRVAWRPGQHLVWGALSRAVRTPSRLDRHLFFPAEPPFVFAGGPEFDSETVVVSEGGWRLRPRQDVFISAAVFLNAYDRLRTTSPAPPFVTENNAEGEIWGTELEGTWQVTPQWRLAGGYTLLQEDLRVKAGLGDRFDGQGDAFDPEHQFQIRCSWTLPRQMEADLWTRHVGRISNTARGFAAVPAYTAVDARVAWSPVPSLQLAVIGQNLAPGRHREFGNREVERSGSVKAMWRF